MSSTPSSLFLIHSHPQIVICILTFQEILQSISSRLVLCLFSQNLLFLCCNLKKNGCSGKGEGEMSKRKSFPPQIKLWFMLQNMKRTKKEREKDKKGILKLLGLMEKKMKFWTKRSIFAERWGSEMGRKSKRRGNFGGKKRYKWLFFF